MFGDTYTMMYEFESESNSSSSIGGEIEMGRPFGTSTNRKDK
jgi:hypothetical protein